MGIFDCPLIQWGPSNHFPLLYFSVFHCSLFWNVGKNFSSFCVLARKKVLGIRRRHSTHCNVLPLPTTSLLVKSVPRQSPEIPIKKTSLLQVLSSPAGGRKENSKEKLSPLVWTLFLKSGVGKVGCVFKNPIFWSVRLTVRSSSSKPPCRHPPPTPPQKRRVFGIQPIPLLSFLVGGDSFVHILSLLSPPLY